MKKSELYKIVLNYSFIGLFGALSYTFINYKSLKFHEFIVLGSAILLCALFIFFIADGASDD